ncbi:class I SAM-dependent methyltransferase [Engelhardtia mirabilis]|uniref:Methyltransferase domain protein n=1 Tax=Engelhardtia mirabilis TaxID=2528011 RepID=A0A518BN23_9BACT|nr:hypothetical protein Pla133_34530 [Planctomycetes bacterium Pla133]QDV02683.1 hypothetical protein Pla86_34520 [Planctomycetes bacterium Pla86]
MSPSSTAKKKSKSAGKQAERKPSTKRPAAAAAKNGPTKSGPKKSGKAGAKAKGAGKKRKVAGLTAATADKYELYQAAVQSPGADVDFLIDTFKKLRNKEPRHLREDFCGTGYLLAEWLRRNKKNTAEGFDNDPEPIEWGLAHNFDDVKAHESRLKLHLGDVREPSDRQPDIRTAPNFSWMIFTERAVLLEYFKAAHADLADKGLFVMDIYGGPEAFEELEEEREIDGANFTYVWDQDSYHPASGRYRCKIHFRFEDGSEIRDMFDYDWRLWFLPEVVDILREAGFSSVDSYWEGTEEDDEAGEDDYLEGNGEFEKSDVGENCPAWVTYIVAQK